MEASSCSVVSAGSLRQGCPQPENEPAFSNGHRQRDDSFYTETPHHKRRHSNHCQTNSIVPPHMEGMEPQTPFWRCDKKLTGPGRLAEIFRMGKPQGLIGQYFMHLIESLSIVCQNL